MNEVKAVFLDRDGVINIEKEYVYKIKDFEFIPKSIKALKKLKDAGYKLILIFGQSGIKRKKYTEKDLNELMKYIFKELKNEGVELDDFDYCPHRAEDNCKCRKPKTQMIDRMIKKFNLDPKQCWNIGDKTADMKMGETVGCKNILVKTGYGGKDGEYEVHPDYIAKDLFDASTYILERDKKVVLEVIN